MTAQKLTIEEVAERIGRTDRTVRRYIKDKRLVPTHPEIGHKHTLLFDPEQVEQLKALLEQEKQLKKEEPNTPDTISTQLQQRVTDQAEQLAKLNAVFHEFMKSAEAQLHDLREVEIKTLQERINELAEQLALQRAVKAVQTTEAQEGVPEQVPLKNAQKSTTEATETPASAIAPYRIPMQSPTDKPPDAIPYHEFVKKLKTDGFSINARSFRDRMDAEFAHYGYYHEKRDEWKRYVSTEQQETIRKALQGQQSTLPDGYIPLNTSAKEHGLNRNDLEQLGHQGMIQGIEHGKWITRDVEKVTVALTPEGQKNALKYYRKG